MSIAASKVARERLATTARRMGTADPTGAVGPLLDRSFYLPLGDERYGENALVPGSFPLEHSFSELSRDAIRFALQPLGPEATPGSRRNETSREVRRLVHGAYGNQALHWFDEHSEAWRGSTLPGDALFGAWFGASFDRMGLKNVKAYYEMTPDQVDALSPNLRHATRVAMRMMPGLIPIFTSVTCGRRSGAQRVYLFHRGDLRMMDLEPLMHRLGVGEQLPGLLTALGLILGGRFTLPHGSTVLGLRDTRKGLEMKLEVLLAGFPDPPEQMGQLIRMHLGQRPESLRALHRWIQGHTPDAYRTPGNMSVVSVRVTQDRGPRLNVYFRPVGYDRAASRATRGVISAPAHA